MTRRILVAGNWKMNGLSADCGWTNALAKAVPSPSEAVDIALCPPATLIGRMKAEAPSWLAFGGQDCSAKQAGAHTGDITANMLADLGCEYVIVGHSERRADHGESSAEVRAKAEAALNAGLKPIVCVGETLAIREAGDAEAFVCQQLVDSLPRSDVGTLVVAYEPVWAIGTGVTATPEDAQAMHAALRKAWPGQGADRLQILYGGSVKPSNANQLLSQPDIDGALVGGASLKASDFAAIIQSVR